MEGQLVNCSKAFPCLYFLVTIHVEGSVLSHLLKNIYPFFPCQTLMVPQLQCSCYCLLPTSEPLFVFFMHSCSSVSGFEQVHPFSSLVELTPNPTSLNLTFLTPAFLIKIYIRLPCYMYSAFSHWNKTPCLFKRITFYPPNFCWYYENDMYGHVSCTLNKTLG